MSYEETFRPRKGSDATIQMFRQSDVMMDWINKKRQLATVASFSAVIVATTHYWSTECWLPGRKDVSSIFIINNKP